MYAIDKPNLKYPYFMSLGAMVNQNPIRVSIFNREKCFFKTQNNCCTFDWMMIDGKNISLSSFNDITKKHILIDKL